MTYEHSAAALARRLSQREVSAVELAESLLDRIESRDGEIGAYLKIDREQTLSQAREAQELLDRGEGGPLTGVPVAVKDNISTEGLETTCASRVLEGYIPPFDATVVQRMKRAGLPILGKTNLDEFAMGASTETSAFRITRNPWNLDCSPGGSSGGSAAAVAAGLAPLALGSDTGGSIRQPAALCGIVGFKPTYGRCSRYGLVAFGSSLDQIGPMTRTVEDAALLAELVTGHDPLDGTSRPSPPVASDGLREGTLRGLRVGVPREMSGEATSPEVAAAIEQVLDRLRQEGAEVREISLPSVRYGVSTYYLIAPAEASSNLARFDGIRYGRQVAGGRGHIGLVEESRTEGFGREVKARIMIGTYALSAGYYESYYVKAQQVRAMMRQEFEQAFQEFDVLVSPTSPVPAFRIGSLANDPLALKQLDYSTIPANLAGFPALSIPCGFAGGLPIGLQLMAPAMEDERLFQTAYRLEELLAVATARPPGT
jgi:aspartyl-tRNA(Asn)/glutamyl-tRNA(Gln) amidotransferase subunit A